MYLSELPPEIHLCIIHFLDFPYDMSLRMTNHYFYSTIKPLTHQELLRKEVYIFPYGERFPALSRGVLACSICLRLRSSVHFADKPTRNDSEERRAKRICIECGVAKGRQGFRQNDTLRYRGRSSVICLGCDEFSENAHPRKRAGLCRNCWLRLGHHYYEEWKWTSSRLACIHSKTCTWCREVFRCAKPPPTCRERKFEVEIRVCLQILFVV